MQRVTNVRYSARRYVVLKGDYHAISTIDTVNIASSFQLFSIQFLKLSELMAIAYLLLSYPKFDKMPPFFMTIAETIVQPFSYIGRVALRNMWYTQDVCQTIE